MIVGNADGAGVRECITCRSSARPSSFNSLRKYAVNIFVDQKFNTQKFGALLPILKTVNVCFLICTTLALSPVMAQSNGELDEKHDKRTKEILEMADEIRFPRNGFEVEIVVTSSKLGEEKEVRVYRVLSRGNENSIVQTLEPASERGQNLLMKGRDLWLYLPEVSQPVRLTLAQRLTGQVANGDIARTSFSSDYNAQIIREEKIGGTEYVVMELTAAEKSTTYGRVLLWLEKQNNNPYKAEFYALSGRLLKTARYENYQIMHGRSRPTRLILQDAVKKGDESVIEYSKMKQKDLPDRVFTKEYLRKLD
jgi:hypothetical protein